MPSRVQSPRATHQQDLEPRQLPDQDLDPELLAGPLGNAFAQQLLNGELDRATLAQARALGPEALTQLTELARDPAQREPIETLAELEPTATQLDLLESLELSPLSADEAEHLSGIADSGAQVEELDALGELHEAGAPLAQIGAQLGGAPEAELESTRGAAPAGPDLEAKAVGCSAPSGEQEAAASSEAELREEPAQSGEAEPSHKSWLDHAGDFASGLWGGAKDMVGGAVSMGVGAWNLMTPAVWLFAPERTAKSWETLTTTVRAVAADPVSVWEAFKEPFVKDWTEGRPAAAVGRGVFELASLVVGAKGLDKLAKGSKLLGVVDDAAKLGSKGDELVAMAGKTDDATRVGDEVAGLSDDAAKAGDEVVGVSDDVAKSGDEIAKSTDSVAKDADDAATTEATKQHVHEGETVTAQHSPYFGKWNKKGIHTWDGLVARCAKDGYEIIKVTEDPATGVRRVVIRRHGVSPKTGQPVSGTFEKTIYPKRLTAAQVDEMGEEAFQAARRGDPDTKYDPPTVELKKNGEPKDGYFQATARTPDGAPIEIEGWFSVSPEGDPAISSHTPKYQNDWPTLSTVEY